MLHHCRNFFKDNRFYAIFVKFCSGGFEMRKFFLTVISLSGLLAFCADIHSQDLKARLAENQIITAVEYYNEQQFQKAASILRDVIAGYPDNDAAHFYLGLAEFCMNNIGTAENELEKAVSLDSANFWYRSRLAMVYSAAGKEELTLSIFEDLIKDFPKKYDLYYTMVELYQNQGQQEKALETLTQIETVFGANELTAIARFDLLRNMGREDEGYAYLEDFNRKYSSVQVLSILGDRQLSMYDDSLALSYYNEALDIDPSFAPAVLGKAETYRIARDYDDYFNVLYGFAADENISVTGKCGYINALVRSADKMFFKSFGPQMDSLLTICSEKHPGDSAVNFTSGIYYYAKGDAPRAKTFFRANVEQWPQSLSAAATYVEMLMYMKDWNELVSEAWKSAERFPEETAFLEYASLGEYNLGNYGKVIEICRKVLETAPGDSAAVLNAYTTMGDMYYQTGERNKAFKAYDCALEVNPDFLPVLNNYAYYLSLEKKKLKKAYQMSKKTVELAPDNSTYLDTFGWILYLQGKPLEAKPFFKNAVMLYGGKNSPVVLDHYAEVLFALKEYDLAFLYWNQAKAINNGEIPDLENRISERKSEMKKQDK